jgi:hypothetical protein|nr:MAG TPA: tail sheath protein [Caudoviricetes sp.]
MALGGGTYLVQNKVLPGAYMNFVSASRASATLSDRGIAALPLALDWGPEQTVFAVTNGEFQTDSVKIFGHTYTDAAMLPLRELFQHCKTAYLFRLNSGGTKASCTYAEARYPGGCGNALRVVIEQNEAFEEGENEVYDVSTYLDAVRVDTQMKVKTAAELKANDYVTWKDAPLTATASTPLTSGTDGTVQDAAYQVFLDKIESYSFNTLGCASTNETIKALFAAFTKRLRDEMGIKFQTVLHRYIKPDFEGVVSIENGLVGAQDDPALVYWATGAQAGCAVNQSLTNAAYTGELTPYVDYTQTQLEEGIRAGKFMLHRVGDEVRVLTDINTFVSVTDEKSADFASNQVVRVLDQIANDIALLFNTKYLGKVQNDAAGRVSLWNDIVKHHERLQDLRAIEDFTSDAVTVLPGETKKAVQVQDRVQPVAAMEQLYMTVIVA